MEAWISSWAMCAARLSTLIPMAPLQTAAFEHDITPEVSVLGNWSLLTSQFATSSTSNAIVRWKGPPISSMLWLESLIHQTNVIRSLCLIGDGQRSVRDILLTISSNVGLGAIIFQPLFVATKHACLLASHPEIRGFKSVVDALRTISRVSPLYLWTGMLERIIYGIASSSLYQAELWLRRKLSPYFPQWLRPSFVIPPILTEIVTSPLRVLASQASCRTPWLQAAGYVHCPPSMLSNIVEIWSNEGIAGFCRGLVPITLYRSFTFWPVNSISNWIRSRLTRRETRLIFASLAIGISLASFVYDLKISDNAACPLVDSDTRPPSKQIMMLHTLQGSL